MTKIIDRATFDFLLFDLFGVDGYCGQGRFAEHDRASLDATLDLAERLSEEELWPHARLSDVKEPYLENGRVRILPETIAALNTLKENGFFSAHADYENGGLQMPATINHACTGMMKGANTSTQAYMMLTRAAANLLNTHGTEDQKRLLMRPLLEGRFFGTMCLSEPEAGSSLVDIRTRAEPLGDGRYTITGNKMWISGGDQDASENIVHLVLARLPDSPPGVKGISLFAAPKFLVNDDGSLGDRNGITVAGLNHKMGYRGTSNCLLNFGEGEAAIGTLIGEENRGLFCMFHMMNEARIAVGIGGAMLGNVAYRIALAYANDRRQGRALGNKDPSAPPVRLTAHPDVRRMLLKQKALSEGALALCLYAGTLVDKLALSSDETERHRLNDLLDILTPIVKAWSSDFGLEANALAIQVLGGYGYTRDFPVEQLYRDNRLNAIHEGTNGIQALDLLGRKAVMNAGRAFEVLANEMTDSLNAGFDDPELTRASETLVGLLDRAHAHAKATGQRLADGLTEDSLALASPFLNAMGHIVVGWLWLCQARIALQQRASGTGDAPFLSGKLDACRYFHAIEVPEASAWLDVAERDATFLTQADTAGW